MPVYEYYCDKCRGDVRVTLAHCIVSARIASENARTPGGLP